MGVVIRARTGRGKPTPPQNKDTTHELQELLLAVAKAKRVVVSQEGGGTQTSRRETCSCVAFSSSVSIFPSL